MSARLVGATARLINSQDAKTTVGKVEKAIESNFTFKVAPGHEMPSQGRSQLVTFANGTEITATVELISEPFSRSMFRVVGELVENPIGMDVKLLADPLETSCQAGGSDFHVSVVAGCPDALVLESKESIMGDKIEVTLVSRDRPIKVVGECVLQRIQDGNVRSLIALEHMDRVTMMYWQKTLTGG